MRDPSGRRIGAEEFFAAPGVARKRSLFDRDEDEAEPKKSEVPKEPEVPVPPAVPLPSVPAEGPDAPKRLF